MSATVVRLLPAAEQALLTAYVEGTTEPADAAAIYDALEVPDDAQPPRLEIAVAQILLNKIQDTLPQWTAMKADDTLVVNRLEHKRHKDALLAFNPKLVCNINWADSGPGFSWPEAYHVTYLPGFDKFVITGSRDGADVWGCADHAIGVADGNLDPVDAAKGVIVEYWRNQVNEWDQSRWACVFDEGLIDECTAIAWADEVWVPSEEEEEIDDDADGDEDVDDEQGQALREGK